MKRPRVYGSETKFRAVVARHITSGEELLEQSVGARSLIDALPKQDELSAFLIDAGWGRQFRRWFGTAQRAIGKYLQDQFETVLPILFRGLPPDTGKPRHQVGIDNGEPWLRETLRQLKELQDALGVRRDVATAAPAPAGFEELHASGLVDEKVIADHEKAMRSPRTPKQLAEAIGSAKELTEATLRAALSRLEVSYRTSDDLPSLMKNWRTAVAQLAPWIRKATPLSPRRRRHLQTWSRSWPSGEMPTGVGTGERSTRQV